MNINFISHFEMIERRSAKDECKCKNTENQTKLHYRNKNVTLAKYSQQKQCVLGTRRLQPLRISLNDEN